MFVLVPAIIWAGSMEAVWVHLCFWRHSSYVIVYDKWRERWSVAFLSFDKIWLVPINWIKGWTGWNRNCCGRNGCRTFRNAMWHLVQLHMVHSHNMSRPVQFQLQSGYIVLPPRRRRDLCQPKLHQLRRKGCNFRVLCEAEWRCSAPGLWEINSRVWSI